MVTNRALTTIIVQQVQSGAKTKFEHYFQWKVN